MTQKLSCPQHPEGGLRHDYTFCFCDMAKKDSERAEDMQKLTQERDTEIKRAREAEAEIARLKKEIHDFRSIDRHKDKDWAKWYRCYHDKVEEIAKLQADLKAETESKLVAMGRWETLLKERDQLTAQIAELVKALEQASTRCGNFISGLQPPFDSLMVMNTFVMIGAIKNDCDDALSKMSVIEKIKRGGV